MKNIQLQSTVIRALMAFVFVSALFSFSPNPGGDSFTIYMNDKLLIQQYVHAKEKTKTISLEQASANDVLKIHYSHCGKMGVSRTLFLKDAQNKTVKSWMFKNSDDASKGSMTLQVSELAALQKKNRTKLSLIYSAEQLPDGIVLAQLSNDSGAEASIQ